MGVCRLGCSCEKTMTKQNGLQRRIGVFWRCDDCPVPCVASEERAVGPVCPHVSTTLFPIHPLVRSCLRYAQGIINEGFGQRGAFADIQEVGKKKHQTVPSGATAGSHMGRRKRRALGDGRGGGEGDTKRSSSTNSVLDDVEIETRDEKAFARGNAEQSSTGASGHFLPAERAVYELLLAAPQGASCRRILKWGRG